MTQQQKEEEKEECNRYKSRGLVTEKITNLGTCSKEEATISCPQCYGKGYKTQEATDSYLHSLGVKPHKKL